MNIWDVAWKCELTFELQVFSFLMCRHFGKKVFFLASGGSWERNLSVWICVASQ